MPIRRMGAPSTTSTAEAAAAPIATVTNTFTGMATAAATRSSMPTTTSHQPTLRQRRVDAAPRTTTAAVNDAR